MDLTKNASLIPRIGFVTINTIFLLYFICFLAGVLLFLFIFYYVILMESYANFFLFLVFSLLAIVL